ncbi:hypothetical protein ACHAPU_003952 [Fusarium lateritium]
MAEAIIVLPNRPRTRQRAYKQPPSLDVPDIDQDAAERKRVLNVLAQRRYREKKRLNRLKCKSVTQPSDDKPQSPISQTNTAQTLESQASSDDVLELPIIDRDAQVLDPFAGTSFAALTADTDILAGFDLSITSWSPLPDMTLPVPLIEENNRDETISRTHNDLTPDFGGCDFTMMIGTASFGNSPSSSTESFPDSYHLPNLQITLFKAIMRIAGRLNCNEGLWELSGNSAFNTGTGTPASLLPPAWQPTQSQIDIPHHPVFDLLPWPSVRERVIFITSLPDESRPPRAQGSLACVNFAYDLEDTAEGVRIYGEDPYDPENWEVGQLAFERWWWLFDSTIIATSNRWRRARGAPPLLLKSASSSPSPNSSSSPGIGVTSQK